MSHDAISRFARLTVCAAALAASSVACSDDALAPESAAPMEDAVANAVRFRGTTVMLRVVSVTGQNVDELTKVRFQINHDSTWEFVEVQDNSAKDIDKTVGDMTVVLPVGHSYEACVNLFTKHWGFEPGNPAYPRCSYVDDVRTFEVDMGLLYMRRKPIVSFQLQDMLGGTLTGATVSLTLPGGGTILATDGSFWDEPKVADGKINVILHGPGSYGWCETKAPAGYVLAVPTCGKFDAVWDWDTGFLLKHARSRTQAR